MYHPTLDHSSNPTSSSLTQKRIMLPRCESGFKLRRLNDVVEEGNATQIQPNSTPENNLVLESDADLRPHTSEPTIEEETQRLSAKAQLHNLCCVRHWKAPMYECCAEGPCHMKLFTVKATVEIKEASQITVLECFGDPQQKKKVAAEQAAEAALWYLKNVGFRLQTLVVKGRQNTCRRLC